MHIYIYVYIYLYSSRRRWRERERERDIYICIYIYMYNYVYTHWQKNHDQLMSFWVTLLYIQNTYQFHWSWMKCCRWHWAPWGCMSAALVSTFGIDGNKRLTVHSRHSSHDCCRLNHFLVVQKCTKHSFWLLLLYADITYNIT